MQFNTLIALLIVSCLSLALAHGSVEDCCFKYVKNMPAKTQKHAVAYRMQVLDGGCNIEAVIFIMRRGKMLCANPNEHWVQKLQKRIDAKPKKAQRHQHRG